MKKSLFKGQYLTYCTICLILLLSSQPWKAVIRENTKWRIGTTFRKSTGVLCNQKEIPKEGKCGILSQIATHGLDELVFMDGNICRCTNLPRLPHFSDTVDCSPSGSFCNSCRSLHISVNQHPKWLKFGLQAYFSNIFAHAKFQLPICYTFRVLLMKSRISHNLTGFTNTSL